MVHFVCATGDRHKAGAGHSPENDNLIILSTMKNVQLLHTAVRLLVDCPFNKVFPLTALVISMYL